MTGSVVSSVLSSAVVATSISAIAIVVNAWLANRLKQNSDIDTFRFTKLYELYLELHSLPHWTVSSKEGAFLELCDKSEKHHRLIKKIYNKARPLLEETSCQPLTDMFLSEEKAKSKMDLYIINTNKNPEWPSIESLLKLREECEQVSSRFAYMLRWRE